MLRYKKGLIADGMMKYTRNPNYLGEMMIYGSFVLLVNDSLSYACVMQVWFTLFVLRIWQKERSLRKKEGWAEYKARSWVLVPKVCGSTVVSVVTYGAMVGLGMTVYSLGGMKESLRHLS